MLKNSYHINRLFKFTLVFTILFIVTLLFFSDPIKASTNNLSGYYPTLLQVKQVEYNPIINRGKAILEISSRYQYIIVEPDYLWDMYEGDFYTAIMYDNNTKYIANDIIIDLRYSRPDLF